MIPLWFTTSPPGMFDKSSRVGGLSFNPQGEIERQIDEIADVLVRRVGVERQAEETASAAIRDSGPDG